MRSQRGGAAPRVGGGPAARYVCDLRRDKPRDESGEDALASGPCRWTLGPLSFLKACVPLVFRKVCKSQKSLPDFRSA